jgi:hypothetical protein
MSIELFLVLIAIVCWIIGAIPRAPGWPWLHAGLCFFALAHVVGQVVR